MSFKHKATKGKKNYKKSATLIDDQLVIYNNHRIKCIRHLTSAPAILNSVNYIVIDTKHKVVHFLGPFTGNKIGHFSQAKFKFGILNLRNNCFLFWQRVYQIHSKSPLPNTIDYTIITNNNGKLVSYEKIWGDGIDDEEEKEDEESKRVAVEIEGVDNGNEDEGLLGGKYKQKTRQYKSVKRRRNSRRNSRKLKK